MNNKPVNGGELIVQQIQTILADHVKWFTGTFSMPDTVVGGRRRLGFISRSCRVKGLGNGGTGSETFWV